MTLVETLKAERQGRVVEDRSLPAATALGDAMKETRREVVAAATENTGWFRRKARIEARKLAFEEEINPLMDAVMSAKAGRTGLDDPCLETRSALEAAQGEAYGALALWMGEAAQMRKDPAQAKANEERARRLNSIAIACDIRALACHGREAVEGAGIEETQIERLVENAGGREMMLQAEEERAIMRAEAGQIETPVQSDPPAPVIEDAVLIEDDGGEMALEAPEAAPEADEDPRTSRVRELAERRLARRALPSRGQEAGLDLDN